MTKPTTILKHLILPGAVLLVLLSSLLLPAKLTYAADLFYEMIGTSSHPIASAEGQIEISQEQGSLELVSETSEQLATRRTTLQINPNSAVVNAGNIPVVIKNSKPFNAAVSPTAKMSGVDLQYVIQGDANTIYGVVNPQDLGPGTHDLTVNDGNGDTLLPDAFTVTGAVTPKPYLAMVYMACDNNLSNSCIQLFNNLEFAVHNNPNMRIVAFWDGNRDGDSAYYLIQPDDTDAPDSNPSLGIGMASYNQSNSLALGEVDSADASTLVQFAAWAKSKYPDTYSFLSLVDHGSGWAPDLYPAQPGGYDWGGGVGGLFWDDSSGNVMPTKVLADALGWMTQGGNEFDLIYIDACQMGTVEVMAELAPYADYIISHENFAWASYPYDQFFAGVDISTDPQTLAEQITEVYRDSLPNGHPAQISVIETERMTDVLSALNGFTNLLSSEIWPGKLTEIQEAVKATAHVDENIDFVLDEQDSTIDLYHFASQFIGHPTAPASVKSAALDLMNAIKDGSDPAVVDNYIINDGQAPWVGSDPWDMSNFNGLSIYFPLADEWKRGFYGPDALPSFAANSTWDEFIQEWWDNESAPTPPTDECDPEECIVAPMDIGLSIDEQDVITDTERVVWVPISLQGADETDDIRGVQISVNVRNTSILVPASDLTPRQGDLFPTDVYTSSVATTRRWDFLLTDNGSTETISGTGQVVLLPFRFLVDEGCQDLEFTTHTIIDKAPNNIPHYHEERGQKTRVCHSESGTLDGLVKLERRPPNTHRRSEIKLDGGVHEAQSNNDGEYSFTDLPNGSYTISFDNDEEFFLYHETTVNINGPTSLPNVTLCAGDMDDDNDIDDRDRLLLSLGTIPVSFPAYDLNADGNTNVSDVFILGENIGKVAPNEQCSNQTLRRSNDIASQLPTVNESSVRQGQPRFSTPVQANQNVVATLRAIDIDFNESNQPEGLGTRIALPAGATVSNVELIGDFAGGFLESQQEEDDDILYIVAAFPEGSQLTTDAEIVRFEMSVPESGNAMIEAINPEELRGKLVLDIEQDAQQTILYLPMIQR